MLRSYQFKMEEYNITKKAIDIKQMTGVAIFITAIAAWLLYLTWFVK